MPWPLRHSVSVPQLPGRLHQKWWERCGGDPKVWVCRFAKLFCVYCVKSAILDHNNDAMVLWSFWMYQMDQHKCKFTARHAPLHNVCKVLVLLLLNMNLQIGLHHFVQKIIELQSMSSVFYFFCWTPWGGAEEGGLGDFTDLGMWAAVVSRILELLEFQAGCLWGGAQEEVDSLRLCQFEGC